MLAIWYAPVVPPHSQHYEVPHTLSVRSVTQSGFLLVDSGDNLLHCKQGRALGSAALVLSPLFAAPHVRS